MLGTGGQASLYSGNSKGTNINGADLMLLAGCGTGTGIGGIMRFYTSGPLTSGAAPQSQTSRLEIDNVGQISAKANIASTSTTTGTLKVTGGIGASGSVYATAFNGPLTGNVTGNADTATKTTNTVTGTNSAELVRGNMGDNDQFRILVGATATNSGYAEIATADDGTEPIHVRQYTGVFTTLTRTATLLDGSGNTSFPGTVTAPTFSGALSGNATTATSATYATSAGTASTVTNVPAATATTLGGIKISLNGSTLTISTT